MAEIQINLRNDFFNEAYLPLLENKERFTVLWGGAGSGKSNFVVDKMIIKALKIKRNVLFIRKVQATIKDSIFKLTVDELNRMGLTDHCKISAYNMTVELPNGSLFTYKGIDDPEKIKSIANIDDNVIEEATEITADDFSQLNLRLRSHKPNQQMHLMFNPVSQSNWVYNEFFAQEKANTKILHTTYKDNRFLPKEYIKSLEAYKTTNPLYYDIYALGKWGVLGKKVFTNWETRQFNYVELIKNNPELEARFALDWGFVADPTAMLALLVDEENKLIYIYDEVYQKGLLNSEIADLIKTKGWARQKIVADSAEQKSIADLRSLGITNIQPVKKGKGSIMAGIQKVNEYKLIVSPECKFTIDELEKYVYKKDKSTGLYLNQPVDANNHLMDCLRYAMFESKAKIIKGLSKSLFGF